MSQNLENLVPVTKDTVHKKMTYQMFKKRVLDGTKRNKEIKETKKK